MNIHLGWEDFIYNKRVTNTRPIRDGSIPIAAYSYFNYFQIKNTETRLIIAMSENPCFAIEQ